ncbi:MAG TPA: hypothetical protein VHD60_02405 [Candidatus Saccharimonadales bacterium]|nr:hypothetical protein [Candidatus Saccharimonadales bacterium]
MSQTELYETRQAKSMLITAPLMLEAARRAANEISDSYRVRVGAALLARDPITDDRALYVTANHKPFPGLEIVKHCAEAKGLALARDSERFTEVEGWPVAGPGDPRTIESVVGFVSKTLPMCSVCVQTIDFYQQEGKLKVPDETPIITAALGEHSYQVHSIGELKQAYVGAMALGSSDLGTDLNHFNFSPEVFNEAGNQLVSVPDRSTLPPVDLMRQVLYAATL